MDELQARAECERLAAESPERATHRFIARSNDDGSWSVAKIGIPPDAGPLKAEVRGDEKPMTPDDPRSSGQRAVPPFGPFFG